MPATHRLRLLAAFFAIVALAASAVAKADPSPVAGLWSGTLGDQDIRVCFGVSGGADNGAYYYQRHLQLISLQQSGGDQGGWYERGVNAKLDPAPRWSLSPGPKGSLVGTWTQGGQTLPIRLTQVSANRRDGDEPPCGLMTFLKPRLTAPKLRRTPAVLDGAPYISLIWDLGALGANALTGFELVGDTPALRRVNKLLPSAAPAAVDDGQAEYVACAFSAGGDFGEAGEYLHTVKPSLLLSHWLVTEESTSFFCGGAHPDHETHYQVFDLAAGAKADPWSWFDATGGKAKSPDPLDLSPRLKAMVSTAWRRGNAKDADCKDADPDEWDLHPTAKGLAFFPQLPHVIAPCAADVVIPYATLAPILSPAGRAAMASIAVDLARPPPDTAKPGAPKK